MLTFIVPPGIGDFSAMYAKLCNINREIVIQSSQDQPNRLSPFLDILPRIKNGGYVPYGANQILGLTLPPGTDLGSLPDGEHFLAVNAWLENGGKVADWVPGETSYHYPLNRNQKMLAQAWDFFESLPQGHGPLIGIYCSAYGNSRHWGFWGTEEWRMFLELVRKTLPENAAYIFMGAEYDVQIADYLYAWMKSINCDAYLTLGSFHIGATIEVISALDYFFIFPSGLGFLADVMGTPHTMWFPPHLAPMMGTFCDPVLFEKGTTRHALFSTPTLAFEDWRQHGLQLLEAKWQK
jgi:hypothetical protein